MHIPDGFLDTRTLVVTNGIALGVLTFATRRVNTGVSPGRVPLMGVLAAFAFTVQLLAFPVIGGTSTHITGAVILAIVLGPYTSLLLMGAIVLLQGVLFQHGGILTFGANFINVGLFGSLLGYGLYSLREGYTMAAVAAVVSVFLGGVAAAVELSVSGRIPWEPALWSMGLTQLVAGAVEAFVTVSILKVIQGVRPDLLELERI